MQRRVAFYIRLSKEDGDVHSGKKGESNSITGQRSLLASYVKEHDEFVGWDVVEYFDDGISGSLFAGRDSFQTMLKDATEGRFSCLMVKDFSRLGRDYIEVGNYMEYVFPAMGLRFISINDAYDSLNLRGMTGGRDVAFKNLIHQMYAMDGSRKVKAAKRVRNERGEYTCGLVPYGYRKDPANVHKMVVDEKEAAVVREIFALAGDGCSYNEIARKLNDRGEPTPYDRKCDVNGCKAIGHKRIKDYHVWSMCSVRQIVQNATYKGQMVQNRYETVGYGDSKKIVLADRERWNVIDDAVPAIIDAKTFDLVNRLKHRVPVKRGPNQEVNLFVCPYCGRKLTKSNDRGRYYCPVSKVKSHTSCKRVRMRVQDARRLTLQTVKDIALIVVRNKDYYDEQEKKRIKEIDRQMKQYEVEKERLEQCVLSSYEEYAAGLVEKDEYIISRKACRASIDEIDRKLDDLWGELHRTVKVDDEAMLECKRLQEYDAEMLSKVVEKVLIYDERRIEVVFGADDVFGRELAEDLG